jgi:hypothetical protein
MNVLVLSLLFLLLSCTPALADDPGIVREWDWYLKVESFDWREYNHQARILKESGQLYGLGASALLGLYRQHLLLKLNGELFGSVVGYRGQTQDDPLNPKQSARPVNTDVLYGGSDLHGDLGWNFPLDPLSIEPFAGVGYRWWLRGLQDATALGTDQVPFKTSGYTETWQTWYAKLGTRARYRQGDLTLFAEGGARYPFHTENSVDFVNSGRTTFYPVGVCSGFAETGFSYRHFKLALSYEGYRYSPSPVVLVGGKGFYQPRSASDLLGLSLGLTF